MTWEETAEGDLDVVLDGRPQYRLETRPRALEDFGPTCWWQCTAPGSHFTKGPVCSLPTADGGRVSLAGTTLVTTAADGSRTEERLDPARALEAYRTHFGIVLDRLPAGPGPAAR